MFYKSVLLLILLIYKCQSKPHQNDYKILSYQNENGYKFNYFIDYDTSRTEEANFKTTNNAKILAVSGSYQFRGVAADRKIYKVTYAADENGYRALVKFSESPQHIPAVVLASLAGGGIG